MSGIHPIYDRLLDLQKKQTVNFHMPGHKNRGHNMPWLADAIRLDTTETFGTDNLLHPEEVMKESLERIAGIVGAKHSLFSVNGTTGGLYMAQHIALEPGDTLLVQRDSHKSVYSGAILNRLELDFVYPEYDRDKQIVTAVKAEQIAKKLQENPKIRGVLVVYPNYYGITSDLTRIAEVCHAHDALLIVDEAHGSHLHFSDALPPSALSCGADIVVQSTHKTLPSLTQTSLLHVGERIDPHRIARAGGLFQSTSPSYLFMVSVENALTWMDSSEGRARLQALLAEVDDFRQKAGALPGMELLESGDLPWGLDSTRILFRHRGMSGKKLMTELYEKDNIALEMADLYYALALSTVNNEPRDFDALYEALARIAKHPPRERILQDMPLHSIPATVGMPMYEACYRETERCSVKDSAGRLAGGQITPYPPGVPMVLPGEVMTEEIINRLMHLQQQGIDIIGMSGPERTYVEVLK